MVFRCLQILNSFIHFNIVGLLHLFIHHCYLNTVFDATLDVVSEILASVSSLIFKKNKVGLSHLMRYLDNAVFPLTLNGNIQDILCNIVILVKSNILNECAELLVWEHKLIPQLTSVI